MSYRLSLLFMFLLAVLGNISLPAGSSGASRMSIGDIVFADGTIARAADLDALDNGNRPVAVIAGIRPDGAVFGVGLHRSDTPLPWAVDNSNGYVTKFKDIISTLDADNGNAASVAFAGDTDGSDNWSVIRSVDKSGSANAAKNYPAFNFVNTYAAKHHLTGEYASGWYMPSIAELCVLYNNRKVVNASLHRIYELNQRAAMEGLGTNWYWSSSQSDPRDDYVWFVHYFNGYTCDCPKNFTNLHVIAVRAF